MHFALHQIHMLRSKGAPIPTTVLRSWGNLTCIQCRCCRSQCYWTSLKRSSHWLLPFPPKTVAFTSILLRTCTTLIMLTMRSKRYFDWLPETVLLFHFIVIFFPFLTDYFGSTSRNMCEGTERRTDMSVWDGNDRKTSVHQKIIKSIHLTEQPTFFFRTTSHCKLHCWVMCEVVMYVAWKVQENADVVVDIAWQSNKWQICATVWHFDVCAQKV